ncbi:MAG: MBL fold metallo-hydrolase [archaeon]
MKKKETMKISALSSGSSGNCFYIVKDKEAILIDAGISAKQICFRLASIKESPENLKGIFITHEHSDHIRGADVLSRQLNIPVYATKKTAKSRFLCSDDNLNLIKNNETISLAGMKIQAFPKSHLGQDPVSYSVSNGKKVSIITDAGYACQNIINNISDSDFLCIESNHDIQMLESGPYPYFLKNWIKSDKGHLSNLQSALCILEHAPPKLNNILLSHLSQVNNTPDFALGTFKVLKERKDLSPRISVSERELPTPLFKI